MPKTSFKEIIDIIGIDDIRCAIEDTMKRWDNMNLPNNIFKNCFKK